MNFPTLPILFVLALAATTASAQHVENAADSGTISPPLGFIPQPFDVIHYDAELDLTQAPGRLVRGICDVTIRWVPEHQGARYFAFHLRGPVASSVSLDGTPVTVTTVGTEADSIYHHRVDVPPNVDLPDTSIVRIVYAGTMTDEYGTGYWGGVGSRNGQLYAMGVGFLNNYVSTTQHWLPCYDHPSDKATFTGRFKVLDPIAVAGNGTLELSRRGDTVVYAWTEMHPAATYLLTFAAGPYVPLDFGSAPAPMVVYSQVRDTAATRRSFSLLPRMVALYERRFGAYPYDKVGYVNTPIGAMEHQTMISYPEGLSRLGDTINVVGAHELVHQWFGDLATGRDYRHAWLSESFATFGEALWFEELWGPGGYLADLEAARSRYIGSVASAEGIFPLYDFPRAEPSSNYPETIYQKGAVVVGMLRYEMGDSVFFASLQDYLRRYAYGTATTEELRAVLEEHHGSSLDWFFDQWVYAPGWPVIDLSATRESIGSDLYRVNVTLRQNPAVGDVFFRRLPVELGFQSPGDVRYRMLRLDQSVQTFVLDSVQAYNAITVNRGPSVRTLLTLNSTTEADGTADSGGLSVTVQPNPSDGTRALQLSVRGLRECSDLLYEVFDSSGRRMTGGLAQSCDVSIPLAGIASGAYVVRVLTNEGAGEASLVVAR